MNIVLIFWLSFAFQLIGPFFKIMHLPLGEELLIAGIVSHYLLAAFAITEIWQSGNIHRSEKTMWTVAFLFLGGLVGLLYILMGRKRIVS